MVRGLMPRSNAICLLARPPTSPSSTSRSRFDSTASRPSIVRRSASRLLSCASRLRADRTAASKASSSKGFSRKSTAPIFIASTARGTSPCPVMTMTGTPNLSSRNRRNRSMPLTPGILTSVMTQPASTFGARSRNAAADSWVCTSRPTLRSRKASESRMASSSSITWTRALSDGIAEVLLCHGPQREAKDRSATRILLHGDPPAVGFDDGAGDRQADAHAMALVGDKGLEELGHHLRGNPGAGIGHADGDHVVVGGCGCNHELAPLRCLHRIDGIAQQIDQDLLDLHLVRQYEVDRRVELESDADALILGSDQCQGAGFLDQLLDAFDASLAFAARNEIAQTSDDLSGPQGLLRGLVHGVAQQSGLLVGVSLQEPPRALHVVRDG